jgi:hypothetical protein
VERAHCALNKRISACLLHNAVHRVAVAFQIRCWIGATVVFQLSTSTLTTVCQSYLSLRSVGGELNHSGDGTHPAIFPPCTKCIVRARASACVLGSARGEGRYRRRPGGRIGSHGQGSSLFYGGTSAGFKKPGASRGHRLPNQLSDAVRCSDTRHAMR